jgi:hypothetical protein
MQYGSYSSPDSVLRGVWGCGQIVSDARRAL